MEYLIDVEGQKAELIEAIRFLHRQGWAPATSANYSFRIPGLENYWISRAGIDKGEITERHLLLIDKTGQPVFEPNVRPSAETLMHTMLYENRSTSAIIHTHSVNDTVLSLHFKRNKQVILKGFEILKAIAGIHSHEAELVIPIFENTQDVAAQSVEVREYYKAHPDMKAFLIAGHGLYTWAENIFIAKRQTEAIQFVFECLYKMMLIEGRNTNNILT